MKQKYKFGKLSYCKIEKACKGKEIGKKGEIKCEREVPKSRKSEGERSRRRNDQRVCDFEMKKEESYNSKIENKREGREIKMRERDGKSEMERERGKERGGKRERGMQDYVL